MIIIAELQMQGEKHVQVNAGLLKIVHAAFLKEDLLVRCDTVHEKVLKHKINSTDRISFETFRFTGDRELKKSNLLAKLIRETILAFKIFRFASKQKAVVIFSSAFPFTALFINFFSKLFKQKIIICMHGDLGVLTLNSNKVTHKVFSYIIRLFFLQRSKYTAVLFYGESIKKKLFELFPQFNRNNIITIDHPYEYDNSSVVKNIKKFVEISNIGTGIINKNSHFFYHLAQLCAQEVLNKEIKFTQIGKISTEVLSYANEYVIPLSENDNFLTTAYFEKALLNADYFVYFFSENSLYDLCPSGTFFDSIKYCTPIISLHNPFFDYYFNKLGDIGYLCDDVKEMAILIKKLISEPEPERYKNQVLTLRKAQKLLSIENIANSFQQEYSGLWRTL